jgi:hypothetical protein
MASPLLREIRRRETITPEGFRLSPLRPNGYAWLINAAFAKASLGALGEAVVWRRRAIESNRDVPAHLFSPQFWQT